MEANLPRLKNFLIAQMHRNSIVANNLANLNNAGFKRDVTFLELIQDESGETASLEVAADLSQGQLKETRNSLDLAINGTGFFTVETEEGLAFTRDGHFKLDSSGRLTTAAGHVVLGENGQVVITEEASETGKIAFAENGDILLGNDVIDRLRIMAFRNPEILERAGGNIFKTPEDNIVESNNFRIHQGFLEDANVNPAEEMITLIEIQRQFESSQRMVRTLDDMLRTAVNQIGKY